MFFTLRVLMGGWMFAIFKKIAFHSSHALFGSDWKVHVLNVSCKSFWKAEALKFLNCLVSTLLEPCLGTITLRQMYTRLWSLIPKSMTPLSIILVSSSFVIIKSFKVLVFEVVLVGFLMCCCNWYMSRRSMSFLVCEHALLEISGDD